jgi:hypothetical protein
LIEFETPAQKACYEKVLPWMKEIFGDFAIVRDDFPLVGVTVGSAFGQTGVWAWHDSDAIISTRAYVVKGAELTPDLLRFLLRANDDTLFGAFGIDADGDIFFEHSIAGATCDRSELKASVFSVVNTADRYDEEIVARFGGQRMLDTFK